MDFLKDAFDALSQRIRSPFFGSVFLAFVLLNWKPIWYLIFANTSVAQKFLFFDNNTTNWTIYGLPLILGALLSIAWPWLRLLGAWIAVAPTMKLRNMQSDASIDARIHRLQKLAEEENAKEKWQSEVENAKIEAAKRLREANEVSAVTADEIIEDRAEAETETPAQKYLGKLSRTEAWVVQRLGMNGGGASFGDNFFGSGHSFEEYKALVENPSRKRFKVDIQAALKKLRSDGLLENTVYNEYEFTKFGFDVYDLIVEARTEPAVS